ncbi:MAG: DUF2092 domain-containing protein [Planctomycetota bacterium]
MSTTRPAFVLVVMLIAAFGWFSTAAQAQSSPSIEPKAEEAFRAAADTLAKAKSMSFKADVSRDVVLAYGQKLQLSNQREINVFRPGSIRGNNEGDLDRVDYWLHQGQLCVLDNNHGGNDKLDTPATQPSVRYSPASLGQFTRAERVDIRRFA